ncbi:response regulator [Paraglaciecola sp. 2405UD69-4]|uniref:response regulator n=1 Tax=Paraglaciecola sp. 2405UD69-4 TaxID=3391836 RepID=UPI0039C914EF
MENSSVLIVEDSEVDQFIAKYMFNKFDENIEVLQAFDGVEAIDILKNLKVPPLFIFLDINMPRMNGHEFLKEYELNQLSTAPVIMLTSSCQPEEKEKCLEYKSVKKYLTKPLEVEDIAALF